MRLHNIIPGLILMFSFGLAQAGEARHYLAVANESSSIPELDAQSYRYGYDFSNLIALEIDYNDGSATGLSSLGVVTAVESITNINLRFNKRYEKVTAYLSIGASHLEGTEPLDGYSYGIGFELYGTKNTALTLGWQRRLIAEDSATNEIEITTTSIGLLHHFDWARTVSRY